MLDKNNTNMTGSEVPSTEKRIVSMKKELNYTLLEDSDAESPIRRPIQPMHSQPK